MEGLTVSLSSGDRSEEQGVLPSSVLPRREMDKRFGCGHRAVGSGRGRRFRGSC